ncbi:MAG: GGDEF domain-containing protein [Candidatus Fermentithermobacillus carboniphilus]|uniref:GGDEF domain-containing protein n=1 Tax=Candidatus Fermentithermobacillus carboniphilus TaxID=3085328 RepID=A0AAT9LEE9_9FIRM|nr:MAG: GGDEF domain-containing protein [Candidatus Fermentithermobacillus carboniphilus]
MSEDIWHALGRLRIGLGASLVLLALVFRVQDNLSLCALLVFFTVGFVGVNTAGLVCSSRCARLVEFGSMVFGLGAISCLVLATGGPHGPLSSLFLIPILTYGFRSGPRVAYLSAAVNSMALVVMLAHSPEGSFSTRHPLGPFVVIGLMWLEAYAVDMVVRHIVLQREELMQLAQQDPLTGLLNRRSLYQLLSHLITKEREFAVILVDLDRFKAVNDEHGHLFGDEVLRRVAEAMQCTVREGDVAARYGGDEFAVAVRGGRGEGERVMLRLQEAVATVSRDMRVDVGLSGGVAVWPSDGATLEELLQEADRRLYRAKELKCRNQADLGIVG